MRERRGKMKVGEKSSAKHLKEMFGVEMEPISESAYQSFVEASHRADKKIQITNKILAESAARAHLYPTR